MSAPIHISQYTQYKQDTNDVATWLLTAHPDFKQPKGPGRLKGKARRAAREEAEAGNAPPAPESKEYTLTLHEFVDRAKKIVVSQRIKEVPRQVAIKLRRSIVRRRYQQRYYEHGGDADSNASHAHFISVLENVEKALMPILPTEFRVKEGAEEDDVGAAAVINRFKALTVEEVADEAPDRDAAADATEAPPTAAVNCKIAEEEAHTLSPIFALELVLEDLWLVTKYVRESWQAYRDGAMTLEAATLATEMAHYVFHHTESQLRVASGIDNCPGGWPQAMIKICMVRHEAEEKGETQGDGSGFADFLLDLIYIVHTLAELLGKRRGLDLSDFLRVQTPTLDWASYDRRLLQRVLLDEAVVQNHIFPATPGADVLAFGDGFGSYLRHFFGTSGVITLTAVYMTMFYLEMRLTMGSESGKAWPELRNFMETTRPHMSQINQRYRHLAGKSESLRQVMHGEDFWLKQAEIVMDDGGADSPSISAGISSHHRITWFSSNPWLCGRLLMIYKTVAYCTGIYWANFDPAPVAICHLYNAAKQEKVLPDGWAWPGVERLISRHPDLFGNAPRPKAWCNYSQSLARALGGHEAERRNTRRGARGGGIRGGIEGVNLHNRWQFPNLILTLREIQIRWLGNEEEWSADEIARVMRESWLSQKLLKSTIRPGAEPKLTMIDALRRLRKCINAEMAVLNDDAWLQYQNSSVDICTRLSTEPEFAAVRQDSMHLGYPDKVVYLIVLSLLQSRDRNLLKEAARIMQAVVSESMSL